MLGTKCEKRQCPRHVDMEGQEICVIAVMNGKAKYIRLEEVTEKMCKQMRIKKDQR